LNELRNDHGHLVEQYNKSKERIITIKKIKNKFPQKVINKIEIIQELLSLYNERKKEVVNQVNIFIRKAFEFRFPGISTAKLRKIWQISPDDAIKLLKGEKIADLGARDKQWVYSVCDGKVMDESSKFLRLVSIEGSNSALKGSPASPGKIKGQISIILNVSQMSKFKKGDILVAPFTNVNYLPVMHQAKAILTETGGLTSHAAIVSRELGKPSIVGIKNLITILNDGDWVEVDADKGTVKILGKP
jgi:phosphoenolpyruvate synthase/pyruvate phosphate dikinase